METGEGEHRQIGRDSLFVMAELRIDGQPGDHRVRVRNVSAGGLMADGVANLNRGHVVWISLRNIGWVEGTIAWVQDNRCGIAFRNEIDPRALREPVGTGETTPRYVKPPLGSNETGPLRKL